MVRIKILNARDVFILWLLCMLCLGMPLTCVEIFVCVQGFSRQCPLYESLKIPGTKSGVR